jgi:hypothetical protein
VPFDATPCRFMVGDTGIEPVSDRFETLPWLLGQVPLTGIYPMYIGRKFGSHVRSRVQLVEQLTREWPDWELTSAPDKGSARL